jgi:hypothetical protein
LVVAVEFYNQYREILVRPIDQVLQLYLLLIENKINFTLFKFKVFLT